MAKDTLLIIGDDVYGVMAEETAKAMGPFGEILFVAVNSTAFSDIPLESYIGKYKYAFVGIEDKQKRLELIQKLDELGFIVPVIVNAQAYVSPSSQIGKGTLIMAGAVVNARAAVSIGCVLFPNSVVNHGSFVGDLCHIGSNATISSGALVPACADVKDNMVYTVTDIEGHVKEILLNNQCGRVLQVK